MNDHTRILVLTIAAALGLACQASPPAAAPAGTSQEAPPPAAKARGGGGIAGRLTASTGDPWAGGGVVYLEDAPKRPGVATSAEIDISHKVFTPLITVVTTSATVTFGNKDALTHHIFSPEIPGWDTGYLRKNDTATRRFDTPGAVALLCNIHPEMIGYLLVVPSTYFGEVGPDGKYLIPGVPPGTYRATAWVPRLPVVTQSVTVPASRSVTADFAVPPSVQRN